MSGGGPKTVAGKQIVAKNAISHGILAESPTIPGESSEEWEIHLAGTRSSLTPSGHLEDSLVERIALLLWRLGRVARYEVDEVAIAQDKIREEITNHETIFDDFALLRETRSLRDPEVLRSELEAARERADILEARERAADNKRYAPADAIEIVFTLAEHVPDVDFTTFRPTGTPDGMDWEDLQEWKGWRASIIRATAQDMSASTAEDVENGEDLLDTALEYERRTAVETAADLKKVETRISRRSKERALPPEDALNRIVRYEAHLHRQLIATLRELEAIQGRRMGEPTPLARLDVSGSPEIANAAS